MRNEFQRIFNEKIGQLTFLDREKVIDCMEIAYQIGKSGNLEKYGKLKNTFEELLDEFELSKESETPINELQEHWKTKAGLL